MHWLNCFLQVTNPPLLQATPPPDKWSWLKDSAAVLSSLAALANLGLALVIYRYTRQKNLSDTKIKWFLELVYAPNKEQLWSFFDHLHTLKNEIPSNGQWTEQQRIDAINFIKTEERNLRRAVVNVLQAVAPIVYKEVDAIIVGLTDSLTRAIGDDQYKLEHPKVFERLIYEPINNAKAEVVKAFFKYSG